MIGQPKRGSLTPLLLLCLIWAGAFLGTGRAAAQTGPNVIDGFVINDVRGDDIPDNDPGIAGVTLTLRDAGGAVVGTTQTGANGEFTFSNLATGTYTVAESVPTGFIPVDAIPGIRAISVVDLTTLHIQMVEGVTTYAGSVFLNRQSGTAPPGPNVIKGYVIDDLNGNGMQDAGEPWVNGVQITLLDASNQLVGTRFTQGFGGNYAFTGLPGGTYTVVETVPSGFTAETAIAGPGGQVVDTHTLRVTTTPGTVSYDFQVFLVRESQGGVPAPTPGTPTVLPPPATQGPSVSLSLDKATAAPGDMLTYTLVVSAGPAPLGQGAVLAAVPAGTQFVDASTGGVLWGDTVAWPLSGVAAGGQASLSFRALVGSDTLAGTLIQGLAQLEVVGQTTLVSSLQASTVVALPGIPLTLLTQVDRHLAQPGGDITYRFTYRNVSSAAIGSVTITAPIPAGLLFLTADTNVQVDPTTRTVLIPVGSLAPGASGTVSFRAQIPANAAAGTTFTSQASIQAAGLTQPIPGNSVTVAAQLIPISGTYKHVQTSAVPVSNPTSLTVDAQGGFTLTTLPADQPVPGCQDVQGMLDANGAFDVTTASGRVRFTGRVDPSGQSATVTVQQTGLSTYTEILTRTPDFNSLPASMTGTFTGLAVDPAGDAIHVHMTIDAGGNATFEADLLQLSPSEKRCRTGAYQVSADGAVGFGTTPDGHLVPNGSPLTLMYDWTDPDGYHGSFQVPLVAQQ